MMTFRSQSGFVLLELVTTLVIVGFIGAFAGLFLWSGINGYMDSKRNSEAAISAQTALDRISSEIRFVSALPVASSPTSITYSSTAFPSTPRRRICYDPTSKTIYLSVSADTNLRLCGDAAENPQPLIKNVETFSVTVNSRDMDNLDGDKDPSTGSKEVSTIAAVFTLSGIGARFGVEMHPRCFIAVP